MHCSCWISLSVLRRSTQFQPWYLQTLWPLGLADLEWLYWVYYLLCLLLFRCIYLLGYLPVWNRFSIFLYKFFSSIYISLIGAKKPNIRNICPFREKRTWIHFITVTQCWENRSYPEGSIFLTCMQHLKWQLQGQYALIGFHLKKTARFLSEDNKYANISITSILRISKKGRGL